MAEGGEGDITYCLPNKGQGSFSYISLYCCSLQSAYTQKKVKTVFGKILSLFILFYFSLKQFYFILISLKNEKLFQTLKMLQWGQPPMVGSQIVQIVASFPTS
jgi:hypothetical protein